MLININKYFLKIIIKNKKLINDSQDIYSKLTLKK